MKNDLSHLKEKLDKKLALAPVLKDYLTSEVLKNGKISISLLMRKLKITESKAKEIISEFEKAT